MTLNLSQGEWTPTIKLVDAITNATITPSVTYYSTPPSGDCYGSYLRVGDWVMAEFCIEFNMAFSGLANPCVVQIAGLPYRPSEVGQDPNSATVTTRGTGLGQLFISNHSRFAPAVLPNLPAGMTQMQCVATPFWNAIHFEGLSRPNTTYTPRLLTTEHFTSGSRRYLRGNVRYTTSDD